MIALNILKINSATQFFLYFFFSVIMAKFLWNIRSSTRSILTQTQGPQKWFS